MTAPKDQRHRRTAGQQDEHQDRQRAAEVDERQQVALRHAVAETSPPSIEPKILNSPMTPMVQPPTVGRKSAIDEIGRQVHGDEDELETAGENTDSQQHIGAVAEGLGERLPLRLPVAACVGRRRARRHRRAASDSGSTASTIDGEDQRAPVASRTLSSARRRAARTGTGRTSRPPCPAPNAIERHFGGRILPKAPSTTMNEQPARPKPISTPADRSSIAAWSHGHQHQAEGVHQRAAAQHPDGPKRSAIMPANGCADAPQQHLHRQREGEHVAAPMIGGGHRREEEAEVERGPKRSARSGSRRR